MSSIKPRQRQSMPTLLIGGDLCPINCHEALFREGCAETLFNDLLSEIQNADLTVVNLECPLIKKSSPIEKNGPVLGASVDCINGLKTAGFSAVNLSNNHILDHGEAGLHSTIEACNGAGIEYFGAGSDLDEASKMFCREINGCSVGFLGVAEHEFSIADEYTGGANPLDLITIHRVLKKARSELDFIVILLHGGQEHYKYPTPRLQNVCRFLIEEGAGAVICQHSHCIGCYEYYRGAPIVYGQGNFIFDPTNKKERSWHEGLLVKLFLDISGRCRTEWIPFVHSFDGIGARRMTKAEEQHCLDEFHFRASEISIAGFVQKRWLEYCRMQKYVYASRLRGHNKILRMINNKISFSDWFYSKQAKLIQRNVVECETHREILETIWRDNKTAL